MVSYWLRSSCFNAKVTNRFDVYVVGMELVNGFYELADAKEQRQRFENELAGKQGKARLIIH